ncbi:lantibiotic dehydratase [Streptomyces sp. NPDC052396]|uniref:lantibiotic dehydratase n=1 Tax=Streptomyces sp. NPDC052396 TaxID=3365689 RepID=UPI0037D6B361
MTEDFSTPDLLGVRIGGLPSATLDELRSPDLWRQLGTVLAGERTLTSATTELSDELYRLIGTADTGKPQLVALRRAVHNRRPLNARCWNDEVRALLPPPLEQAVRDWLRRTAELGRQTARLDELLDHHTRAGHAVLRKAVAEPAVRHGLVLSSPVLHEQLDKWLARPDETPPDRSLALRLAKYLARITVKTTPFSTFTVSGLMRWSTGEPAAPAPEMTVRSVVEINIWLVQQIVRRLSRHPAVEAGLGLRLNPSAVRAADRWEFLGPGGEEPLRTLAASPAVQMCVDVVTETGRTRAATEAEVAARTGSTPTQAAVYVGRLVELGLLEPIRPFADQDMDPLGALRAWTDAAGPQLAGVRAELDTVAAHLDGYPGLTDPQERLRRLHAVEADLRRVSTQVAELTATGGLDLPAKNTFVENAVLTTAPPGPDRRTWAPVLRDLDTVRRLYALLDPALPGRVALADAFTEHFAPGTAVPLLTFHRAVQQWLREDPGLPPLLSMGTHGYRALADHRLPRIRTLARAREELCAAAAPPGKEETAEADRGRLAALMAGWPSWMRAPDSVAFYGQPHGTGEAPRFVVNAVNSGHGRGRDRIARLLVQAGAGAGAGADAAPDGPGPADGVLLADTCRHFGSNVGLRTSLVPFEIDYPEGRSLGDPDRRIPLADLEVRHDPAQGLLVLWSRSRDAEVRPVHPNLIAELWLPPVLRLLLQAFGTTSNLLIPGRRMFGDTSLDAVDGLLAEPRVMIGQVTVSRRQWVFPASLVPARAAGESDRRHLLRLAEWLGAHGIPPRCFVRALDPGSVLDGSIWRVKSRKPLYADFANPLLTGVFERLLGNRNQVLFLQEALPDPSDFPHHGAHGSRATEYIIEINGGHHAPRA